jgi:hypothetical protein
MKALAPIVTVLLAACGQSSHQAHPDPVLEQYVELISDDPDRAYDLLSESQRARITRDEFREAAARHPEEIEAQVHQLRLQLAQRIPVRADVPLASGEVIALVLDGGRWRIADGLAGATGLASPLETVRALRRALQRRSYQALLHVLSRDARSQVDDEIDRVIEGLGDEESLRIDVTGNRARVVYEGDHVIDLIREDGIWVVEDMN